YGCFPRVGNRDLNPSRGEGSGLAMVRTCATLELGPVAQRLEQQTHNLLVAGSNPAGPTTVAHRSFAAAQLRISARGSNAAKAPQVQILPGPINFNLNCPHISHHFDLPSSILFASGCAFMTELL